eukprot:UN32123
MSTEDVISDTLKEEQEKRESALLVVKNDAVPDQRVDVSFEDLTLKLGSTTILKGISGRISGGKMMGILGQSGSGKTSLIRLLSGQIDPSCWSGEVKVNNLPFDPLTWGSRLAIVEQQSDMYPTLTPRELLEFSLNLRLKDRDVSEVNKIIEETIRKVGIETCADSLCGNARRPGISGGEMKRTAIATELICNPKCIFLDEPTSGLDAYLAYTVIKMLQNLAHEEGATVCVTIHQPSSEIVELFDEFIIMHKGDVVCSGTLDDLRKFMVKIDRPCPVNYNLLDHILFQVQKMSDDELTRTFSDASEESDEVDKKCDILQMARLSAFADDIGNNSADICTQFYCLLFREAKNLSRNKTLLILRFVFQRFLRPFILPYFIKSQIPKILTVFLVLF